jgi:hypothetical protein
MPAQAILEDSSDVGVLDDETRRSSRRRPPPASALADPARAGAHHGHRLEGLSLPHRKQVWLVL